MGSEGKSSEEMPIRGSGIPMDSLKEKAFVDLVNNLDAVMFDCDGKIKFPQYSDISRVRP
jgi:hypothetical protein